MTTANPGTPSKRKQGLLLERSFSTSATLLPRKTAAQLTGISYVRPDRWELHNLSSHDV